GVTFVERVGVPALEGADRRQRLHRGEALARVVRELGRRGRLVEVEAREVDGRLGLLHGDAVLGGVQIRRRLVRDLDLLQRRRLEVGGLDGAQLVGSIETVEVRRRRLRGGFAPGQLVEAVQVGRRSGRDRRQRRIELL